MRAQQFSNPLQKPHSGGSVQSADRVSEHPISALRGLLIAGALSTPIWLALYLLLR
jgi:hypothetical protein